MTLLFTSDNLGAGTVAAADPALSCAVLCCAVMRCAVLCCAVLCWFPCLAVLKGRVGWYVPGQPGITLGFSLRLTLKGIVSSFLSFLSGWVKRGVECRAGGRLHSSPGGGSQDGDAHAAHLLHHHPLLDHLLSGIHLLPLA